MKLALASRTNGVLSPFLSFSEAPTSWILQLREVLVIIMREALSTILWV